MIPKRSRFLLGPAAAFVVFAVVAPVRIKRHAPSIEPWCGHSDAGREAYAEGNLVEAAKRYDRALLRAWATDDPYESGSVAYNLAACLVSQGKMNEASDWLTDARVELSRGKASSGNAWLLSSEIAMAQNRFDDATRLVDYALELARRAKSNQPSAFAGRVRVATKNVLNRKPAKNVVL